MAKEKAQKAKVLGLIVIVLALYIISDKTGLLVRKNVTDYVAPKTMNSVPSSSTEESDVSSNARQNNDLSIEGGSKKSTPTCQEALAVEYKSTSFQKGSVIASFEKGVTWEEAVALVERLGYSADTSEGVGFSENYSIMTVKVSSGKEFDAICILRSEPDVKTAIANTTFSIHE